MEFNIDANELHRVIKLFSFVVKVNAIDSSGRILIEAKDGGVEFVTNNNSLSMVVFVPEAEVKTTGSVALVYNTLRSFVTSFSPWDGESGAKNFKFIKTDKTTNLTVENVYSNGKISKGRLKLINFNPALITRPIPFTKAEFSLNSTVFRLASSKVIYAIDIKSDNSIPAIQGMNVSFTNDYIYFAGTDGRVLSEFKVNNTSGLKEGNYIISLDFLTGLRRMISDNTQLLWEIKGNSVIVKFDNTTFSGRRIIGYDYPDYQTALSDYTDHINVNKEALIKALLPFVNILDSDDNCRITFQIKDKTLRFFNDYADVEFTQDIIGGLDFTIDVNGKLLMNTIESIKDEYILVKFSNSDGVLIFDSSSLEDQKSLITPIVKRK